MRSRHTRKDANHAQVVADLRAAGCIVVDVSDLPGDAEANPLDLFVLSPDRRHWLQVEIKPGVDAPFTVNETNYLDMMGYYRSPIPYYCGIPILVAYSAADVLATFEGMDW